MEKIVLNYKIFANGVPLAIYHHTISMPQDIDVWKNPNSIEQFIINSWLGTDSRFVSIPFKAQAVCISETRQLNK